MGSAHGAQRGAPPREHPFLVAGAAATPRGQPHVSGPPWAPDPAGKEQSPGAVSPGVVPVLGLSAAAGASAAPVSTAHCI